MPVAVAVNLHLGTTDMSELSKKDQKQVIQNLDFSSSDIRVWCFHVNRQHIENYISDHKKLKKFRFEKKRIHKNFDLNWFRLFRNEFEVFVTSHGKVISDIIVQTDADMQHTITNWRMANEYKGRAHELADAVVWCNQKNIKTKNCKVMDLREDIKKSMKRDLLE